MRYEWDAIIVGARCAGSPIAMLLARKGYRILLVDRSTFPSDTLSTHIMQPLAVAALSRWGLLDELKATCCPAIHTYSFDFDDFTIAGVPGTEASPLSYCPRRTILDKLLLDAAIKEGVEVREGFSVEGLVIETDRVVGIRGYSRDASAIVERAKIIIGADGKNSLVASRVGAESYKERPPYLATYYAYWSGLPMDGRFESYMRSHRVFAAAPTHNDLTLVTVSWPYREFAVNKADIEGNFLDAIAMVPAFSNRLAGGKRETRFMGGAVPNYFRKPYGPGWALVGDAGYNRDPITSQGIGDAFRDAELCAEAVHQTLTDLNQWEDSFSQYHLARDAHVSWMYEHTCSAAELEPLSDKTRQLFDIISGDQVAMNDFVRMNAGTISSRDFWSPKIVKALMVASQ